MPKCIVNAKWYGPDESGANPRHFGFECRIEDGNLVADVPDELLQSELAAGRVKLLEPPTEP